MIDLVRSCEIVESTKLVRFSLYNSLLVSLDIILVELYELGRDDQSKNAYS